MHDAADLLRAIAWPLVALIALATFRAEFRAIVSELASKIGRASRIKLNRTGFELAEELVRGSVARNAVEAGHTEDAKQEFKDLADRYDKLHIADLQERVAARNMLSDRLGALAVSQRRDRKALAESRSEGELVALATACVLKPASSDLAALERAAVIANFRFTRYRIGLALVPILARPRVGQAVLQRVATILEHIEERDDAPDAALQRLIDRLRSSVSDLREQLA